MKNALKPDFKRFEFQAGLDGFRWGGELTEGDPAMNPANRLRRLINGRVRKNGDVVDRPGLTPFDATPIHDSAAIITHIDDFPVASPVKLWIAGDGCPGVSPTVGFHLSSLDIEQDPEFQRNQYYSGATSVAMADYDEALHLGIGSSLKRLQLIIRRWGVEFVGADETSPIYDFTLANGYDADYTINCMMAFDGKLFIGLRHTASPNGSSKVVTWDGLSIRDDLPGLNPPTAFGIYRAPNGGEAIVLAFGGSPNHIRYRIGGSSPGTWTIVAPGAGTVAGVNMATYRDVLYIADGGANVWSYDTASLAIARSPAGAVAVRSVTNHIYNNTLQFCYDTATAAIVGKRDSAGAWTDVEKNITAQFATATSARDVEAFRGNLYVCGVGSAAGRVWFSPGANTAGSWTEIVPNATNCGDFDQLLAA